jgi:hypothetical protein
MKDSLNYEQAYYHLYNAISDIIETLKSVQCQAEEIAIREDMEQLPENNQNNMGVNDKCL